MDFVTHTLIGVGCARLLLLRRPELLPQATITAMLGSLVMDADGVGGLALGAEFYGKWHRVATHSLVGLVCCAGLAAVIGWGFGRVASLRKFGWYLSDRLPPDAAVPDHCPMRVHVVVACVAAAMHFAGDAITGYGNLHPFWPWESRYEASLHAVNSFDPVMLGLAVAWHVAARGREWRPGVQLVLGATWLGVVAVYVLTRLVLGEPTVW